MDALAGATVPVRSFTSMRYTTDHQRSWAWRHARALTAARQASAAAPHPGSPPSCDATLAAAADELCLAELDEHAAGSNAVSDGGGGEEPSPHVPRAASAAARLPALLGAAAGDHVPGVRPRGLAAAFPVRSAYIGELAAGSLLYTVCGEDGAGAAPSQRVSARGPRHGGGGELGGGRILVSPSLRRTGFFFTSIAPGHGDPGSKGRKGGGGGGAPAPVSYMSGPLPEGRRDGRSLGAYKRRVAAAGGALSRLRAMNATVLQAAYRGARVRLRLARLCAAAVVMQAAVRGFAARSAFARARRGATALAAAARGVAWRRVLRALHRGAKKVQCAWRCATLRRRVRRRRAATRIGALARAHLRRNAFLAGRCAVVALQALARMRPLRAAYVCARAASVAVQRGVRAWMARRRVAAALRMQCAARRRLAVGTARRARAAVVRAETLRALAEAAAVAAACAAARAAASAAALAALEAGRDRDALRSRAAGIADALDRARGGGGASAIAAAAESLTAVFDLYDVDSSGGLDPAELAALMVDLCLPSAAADLERACGIVLPCPRRRGVTLVGATVMGPGAEAAAATDDAAAAGASETAAAAPAQPSVTPIPETAVVTWRDAPPTRVSQRKCEISRAGGRPGVQTAAAAAAAADDAVARGATVPEFALPGAAPTHGSAGVALGADSDELCWRSPAPAVAPPAPRSMSRGVFVAWLPQYIAFRRGEPGPHPLVAAASIGHAFLAATGGGGGGGSARVLVRSATASAGFALRSAGLRGANAVAAARSGRPGRLGGADGGGACLGVAARAIAVAAGAVAADAAAVPARDAFRAAHPPRVACDVCGAPFALLTGLEAHAAGAPRMHQLRLGRPSDRLRWSEGGLRPTGFGWWGPRAAAVRAREAAKQRVAREASYM